MSLTLASASSQRITSTGAPITGAPLTIFCNFNPVATNVTYAIAGLDSSTTASRLLAIQADGAAGAKAQIAAVNGGTFQSTNAGINFSASAWQSLAGVFASATSRVAYMNGGNPGSTGTTSIAPDTINRISIGARGSGGSFLYHFNGSLSDVAMWSAELSSDEIASLGKGFKPSRIRPQSLVFYAPLIRDIQDVRDARTLTNTNGSTVSEQPRRYG